MNIDEILDKFKIDIVSASMCREYTIVDKYHDCVEESKKIAKDRIIELIKKTLLIKKVEPGEWENGFNSAIDKLERNLGKL